MSHYGNGIDVVVAGAGTAGMTAAVRAHDLGLSVAIVEAGTKIGGSTAFSAGQIWIGANHVMQREGLDDTVGEARDYIRAIAEGPTGLDMAVFEQWTERGPEIIANLEEQGIVPWAIVPGLADYYFPGAAGSKPQGRYLSCAPFVGSLLGDQRPQLLTGPHFPVGATWDELFAVSGDEEALTQLIAERVADDVLTLGTGLAAHLYHAVLTRDIPILLNHRATDLVLTGSEVTGLRCAGPDGPLQLEGAVILAAGTYDWNMELVKEHSHLDEANSGSVAPPTVRGDAIGLGRQAGARIFQMPIDTAVHVPGYRAAEPDGDDGGYRFCLQLSYPHSFMVNAHGRRFCDDSFYRSVSKALLAEDGAEQMPFFLIWDEEHHQRYGLAPAPPGQPYPAAMNVATADTIAELAQALGLDPGQLTTTAAAFNRHARAGTDPEFHRGQNTWATSFLGDPTHVPSPVLGPVERAPFFGMRMRLLGTSVGAAGVQAGLHGQALDESGEPIPGFYVVGTSAAPTCSGTGYNSGMAISRGLVFGYLAADHLHARLAHNTPTSA